MSQQVTVTGAVIGQPGRRVAVGLKEMTPNRFEAFAPCEFYLSSVVGTIPFQQLIVVSTSGQTTCVDWGIRHTHGRVLATVYVDKGWLIRVELFAESVS